MPQGPVRVAEAFQSPHENFPDKDTEPRVGHDLWWTNWHLSIFVSSVAILQIVHSLLGVQVQFVDLLALRW